MLRRVRRDFSPAIRNSRECRRLWRDGLAGVVTAKRRSSGATAFSRDPLANGLTRDEVEQRDPAQVVVGQPVVPQSPDHLYQRCVLLLLGDVQVIDGDLPD